MPHNTEPFRFSAETVHELVDVIGDDPELLAALEADARLYVADAVHVEDDPDWPASTKELRYHVERIQGAVRRLVDKLEGAPDGVRELAAGWALGQGHSLEVALAALREIEFQASHWLTEPTKPGSKRDWRRANLAASVARTLDAGGIKPTTTSNGKYARVLSAVYSAATGGLKLSKKDAHPSRDLAHGVGMLDLSKERQSRDSRRVLKLLRGRKLTPEDQNPS
jgi:hypothetical protein